jgi:hypothetical protein
LLGNAPPAMFLELLKLDLETVTTEARSVRVILFSVAVHAKAAATGFHHG